MIISSVKEKIVNYLDKRKKHIYRDEFKNILLTQKLHSDIIDVILKEFNNNFDTMFVESTTESKDIAFGIMWFTLFNYCELCISTNSMSYKRMIFLGTPGCGKTSYIYSLIKKLNLQKIRFYSDNKDSYFLLKDLLKEVEILEYKDNSFYNDIEIYECNHIDSLKKLVQKYNRARIFLCLPINCNKFTINQLYQSCQELKIQITGIIVTKLDAYENISSCLYSHWMFKNKIISFSSHEIKSKNRCIQQSQILSTDLLDKIFNKKMYDIETIKSLFSGNINAIDLKTYGIYIQFLMKFESVNTDKIMNMIGNIAKKVNSGFGDNVIKNIQNMNLNADYFKKLKKHTYILNSMRACEKKHTWIIDYERIKRIALGSGVSVQDVKEMLHSFEKYKQAMKYMNYYKFIDNIK